MEKKHSKVLNSNLHSTLSPPDVHQQTSTSNLEKRQHATSLDEVESVKKKASGANGNISMKRRIYSNFLDFFSI
ncbi:hypothetical protein HMI55_004951, partial [Coelomomyces lativittatus]